MATATATATVTVGYLRLRLRDGAEFNPMLLLDFLRRAASSAKSAGAARCAVYQGIDVDFENDEDEDEDIEDDDLLESLQGDAHRDFYLVFTAPHEKAASLVSGDADESTRGLLSRVFHVGRRCAGDLLGGGLLSDAHADVDSLLTAPFASLEFFTSRGGTRIERRPGGLIDDSQARLSPWSSAADAKSSDLGTQPPPSGGLKLAAARLLERNRYV